MEQLIDAVPTIRFNDATVARLGVLLDDAARLAEQHSRFHELDGLVEAFAARLDDADGVWIGEGFGAYIVGFVEVAVEAAVIEGYVEVDDVAVLQDALVRDAVADGFVDGDGDGFGEVNVV